VCSREQTASTGHKMYNQKNHKYIRKLGFNAILKIYSSIIPKQLILKLGWEKGDNLNYTIQGNTLIINRE